MRSNDTEGWDRIKMEDHTCSELCGWLFFLLSTGAFDEVPDRVVLEVQHCEVKFEGLVVAVEIRLFQELSAKD